MGWRLNEKEAFYEDVGKSISDTIKKKSKDFERDTNLVNSSNRKKEILCTESFISIENCDGSVCAIFVAFKPKKYTLAKLNRKYIY